ncbi:MAG: MBL fold metallo-hydrolase [Alphaproteobacteria bacterium]
MIFRQFFDKTSCTYTYLIACAKTQEAIIIDSVKEHCEQYLKLIDQLDLKLVQAIDTHIHADHITGLADLQDRSDCETIMGQHSKAEFLTRKLHEGEEIKIGDVSLRAMYTPGHTDDSYCFVTGDRVFTGDTLLIRGTGRTDFQNGSPEAAYDSIFNKVLKLSDDTFVYPAHDYNGATVSTIGEERAHNPRLQVESASEYAEMMNNLNLPNPKMMDIAVPANLRSGRSV